MELMKKMKMFALGEVANPSFFPPSLLSLPPYVPDLIAKRDDNET